MDSTSSFQLASRWLKNASNPPHKVPEMEGGFSPQSNPNLCEVHQQQQLRRRVRICYGQSEAPRPPEAIQAVLSNVNRANESM